MKVFLSFLLQFLFFANLHAEAPNLLTYQGRLKEGGQAVSGNRTIDIQLCDDETVGNCYSSGEQSVTVSNGLFRSTFTVPATALIGTGNWYLKIAVGGVPLTPRERLTSSAYSLFAATAAYASNITAAAGSDGVYITSNVYIVGFSSASKFYGDGSELTNLPASGGAVSAIGDTMTGTLTINAASALTTANQAELVISTNIYVVGYSSAAMYYGNGSLLTGISATTVADGSVTDAKVVTISSSKLTGTVSPALIDLSTVTTALAGKLANNETVSPLLIGLSTVTTALGAKLDTAGGTMTGGLTLVGSTLTVSGNAFSVGGSSLVVADGNVGIGVTNPEVPLEVKSNGTGTDAIRVEGNNGAHFAMYVKGSNESTLNSVNGSPMLIEISGSEKMRISNAGDIGIGAAAPAYKLDVTGGGHFTSSMTVDGGYYGSGANLTGLTDSQISYISAIPYLGSTQTFTGDNTFKDIAARTLTGTSANLTGDFTGYGLAVSSNVSLAGSLYTKNGNVGIGVTAPAAKLHIGGTPGLDGIQFPDGTIMTSAGLGSASNLANVVDAVINADSDSSATGALRLQVGGADKLTILNGGNVGIGSAAPTHKLHVEGNAIVTSSMSVSGSGLSGTMPVFQVIGGTMTVLANGNVGISTGTPQARLDVLAGGSGQTDMAQLWRKSNGDIVSSMSATGVMMADRFVGDGSGLTDVTGDDLGNHTATQVLQMGAYGVNTSSDITAARYQIAGSTVLAILPGLGSLGVGINAGRVNTGGDNSFLGYYAGYSNTTGGYNSFLGSWAGYSNTAGFDNSFLGFYAGYSNTTGGDNSFLGYYAGNANTTGSNNSFLGPWAGGNNTTGGNNSFIGKYAGLNTKTGSANAVFGNEAGQGAANNSFSSSTIMGYRAGYGLTTGNDNILLGFQAGYNVAAGTGNIVIGYGKDTSAAAANNELNIGGVLYGDLSAKTIGISTRMPQAALDIVSTGTASDNIYAQIWRDSTGAQVASMTVTGKLFANGAGISGIVASDSSKLPLTGGYLTGQLTMQSSTLTIINAAVVPDFRLSRAGTFNWDIGGNTGTFLNFVYNTVPRVVFDTLGRVGINTASPSSVLDIYGGSVTIRGQTSDTHVFQAGDNGITISTGGAIQTTGFGHGTVAGNARGAGAVDLQNTRGGAAQVASGYYAVLSGGKGNSSTGFFTVVGGGQNNSASGDRTAVLGGDANAAAGYASVVVGGLSNSAANDYSLVAGGSYNLVSGSNSVISGGGYNTVTGTSSVVAGGENNKASGKFSAIAGGFNNTASGLYAAVGGGQANLASGESSFVGGGGMDGSGGGWSNKAQAKWSAVLGGSGNDVAEIYSVAVGGMSNTVNSSYSTIGGGYVNVIYGSGSLNAIAGGGENTIMNNNTGSFIGGGHGNYISGGGTYNTVVGGYQNYTYDNADYSFMGGGYNNKLYSDYSLVAGGSYNLVSGSNSVISGGGYNTVTGTSSVVAGGENNRATGSWSTIGGGHNNTANVEGSVVAGGVSNSVGGSWSAVSGGQSNSVSAQYSMVPGGYNNTASGNFSFAAGRSAQSTQQGAFTWADSQGVVVENNVADRTWFKNRGGFLVSGSTNTADPGFFVAGNGNVGIGTTSPLQPLHISGSSAGMIISNATAPGATSGGEIYNVLTDVPTAADQRLGRLTFGLTQGGNIYSTALGIGGYSAGAWSVGSSHPTYLAFFTTPAGSNTGPERLRIDQNGNVGIGTTTPVAMLDVNGTVKLSKYLVQAADNGIALAATDFGKTITVNNAAAQTVTLPSVGAGDIGAQVTVVKLGTGKVTIQAESTTSIADSSEGGSIYNNAVSPAYATITLRLVTATKWMLVGGEGSWITN